MQPDSEPKVYAYLNYREFLQDFLAFRKAETRGKYSHRFVAMHAGFSPGYLSRILKGEKNLSEKLIQSFVRLLKLNATESNYFEALVRFNQCSNPKDLEVYRKRLLKARIPRQFMVERDQFEYYSLFHHSVVRSLIGILDISPASKFDVLGKLLLPPISGPDFKHSVDLLARLKLVQLENRGYRISDRFISSGQKPPNSNVQSFLKQSAALGAKSIDYPIASRHHSTLTLGVSDQTFELLQAKISEFRTEIRTLIDADRNPNNVVQIHFQIFPVAKLV